MNKYRCAADGTTMTEAGAFPEHGIAARCPKCGDPMQLVSTDAEEPPVADFSYASEARVMELIAAATPIAQELLRKVRNIKGGRFDIEVPLAFAIGLIAACRNPAGWRPQEMLAIALQFSKEIGTEGGTTK